MLLKTPLPSTSNVPLNDESPIITALVSTFKLPSTLNPELNEASPVILVVPTTCNLAVGEVPIPKLPPVSVILTWLFSANIIFWPVEWFNTR